MSSSVKLVASCKRGQNPFVKLRLLTRKQMFIVMSTGQGIIRRKGGVVIVHHHYHCITPSPKPIDESKRRKYRMGGVEYGDVERRPLIIHGVKLPKTAPIIAELTIYDKTIVAIEKFFDKLIPLTKVKDEEWLD